MYLDTIFLISISLFFFSFYSGIEIAFQSSNKLQIELQGKHGILSGRIFSYFIKNPPYFHGTILLGKVISLVSLVIFLLRFFDNSLSLSFAAAVNKIIILLLTAIATIIVLLVAEFFLKNILLLNTNRSLALCAVPFLISHILVLPLLTIIVSLSKIFTRISGKDYPFEKPVLTLTDLNHYMKSPQAIKEEDPAALETRIFHNALEFKSVRVRECMIPRTEIAAVAMEEGIEKLKETFLKSGHSKIIIYKESIDNVVGFCHSSSLFKKPEAIEDILTPIITVPETTMANELMIKFIDERKSIAIVLDEFGGTSGLVSMEDVIEEIFGEIEDEHDEDDLIEQKISEKNWRLSARLEIDYLNETHHWKLPEGDYETLSGLILAHTENIPKAGDKVVINPYTFTIQSTQDNRIDIVMMAIGVEKS